MTVAATKGQKAKQPAAQVQPLYIPAPYQESAESGRLILRDGSAAAIRPARPEDRDALGEFFARLSPESRYHGFFSSSLPRDDLITSLCDGADSRSKLTLIVTRVVDRVQRIIATGSYLTRSDDRAEIAMAVDDAFQGKGLGTLLLERLALLAVRNGISHFYAVTMQENQRMIDIFAHSGFELSEKRDRGLAEIDLSVAATQASVRLSEMRDRVFTAVSLGPLFRPRAVAVVGASRDPSSIGYRILEALVTNRFQGPVYPVNPSASVVGSIRAYPAVRELPEPVDLAVIAVPRDAVPAAVDDCAQNGVKALVIVTAGFAETNGEGRERQQRLLEKVRGYGMRMVGPNCLGVINTVPEVRLNASFSPVYPPHGPISMSSQRGALGIAILSLARERRLGLSAFVSVGNKADVSGNDLLQYWEDDSATRVILLYLESFGNPRRFARIARRVGLSKPIVAMKAGRTSAGRRAAGSHTAALAANEVAVEALFRQTGVIRAETLQEMFDLAALLSSQPLSSGRRVAIVTNAGGPGILCADACEANGLELPEFSDATRRTMAKFLPAAASLGNPIDMIASAGADQYRRVVQTALAAGEVDALIAIYIPVTATDSANMAEAIAQGISAGRAAAKTDKPALVCWMTEDSSDAELALAREGVPTFTFPESAGRALGKAAAYAEWRSRPAGIVPDFLDIDPNRARAVCRKALAERGPGWLTAEETRGVLEALRLPVSPGGVAKEAEEAAAIARRIGFPVAVKLASHRLVHKTEIGGVRLNLAGADEVRDAFHSIRARLERDNRLDAMEGVLVQPMCAAGVEIMVGVASDPLFGPLIAFGLGGIHVEILRDVCFRITPLTNRDAEEMIREIRGYRLLTGYRGHPAADLDAIKELLLRTSRLVEEISEIEEMDFNPIFALPPGQGCSIVDARVRVGRAG